MTGTIIIVMLIMHYRYVSSLYIPSGLPTVARIRLSDRSMRLQLSPIVVQDDLVTTNDQKSTIQHFEISSTSTHSSPNTPTELPTSIPVFLLQAAVIGMLTGATVVLFKTAIRLTSSLFYEQVADLLPKPSFYWPLGLFPIMGSLVVCLLVFLQGDKLRRGIDFIAQTVDTTTNNTINNSQNTFGINNNKSAINFFGIDKNIESDTFSAINNNANADADKQRSASINNYNSDFHTSINNDKYYDLVPQILRLFGAVATLGSGCSLGPEGPSVEIGAGWSRLVDRIHYTLVNLNILSNGKNSSNDTSSKNNDNNVTNINNNIIEDDIDNGSNSYNSASIGRVNLHTSTSSSSNNNNHNVDFMNPNFIIRRNSFAQRRHLFLAGTAAGVAAGFNAPIAGVFFALECGTRYLVRNNNNNNSNNNYSNNNNNNSKGDMQLPLLLPDFNTMYKSTSYLNTNNNIDTKSMRTIDNNIDTITTNINTNMINTNNIDGPRADIAAIVTAAAFADICVRLGLSAGEGALKVTGNSYAMVAPFFELPMYAGLGVACGFVAACFNGLREVLASEVFFNPSTTNDSDQKKSSNDNGDRSSNNIFYEIRNSAASVSQSSSTTTISQTIMTNNKVQNNDVIGSNRWWQPLCGGILCGVVAVFLPQTLFVGYATLDQLLAGKIALAGPLLIQLLASKVVLTAFSLASGLIGGVFAPCLFFGAVTGVAYHDLLAPVVSLASLSLHNFLTDHAHTLAHTTDALSHIPAVLHQYFQNNQNDHIQMAVSPLFSTNPSSPSDTAVTDTLRISLMASAPAYATVGAAACLAAVFRAPLTATLLMFELTQNHDIVLPVLVSTGIAGLVAEVLSHSRRLW